MTITEPQEPAVPVTDLRRRVARFLVPAAVFLASAAIYAWSPVTQTTDSFWVTYTAVSIIEHRDADLDEYPEALRLADGFQLDHIDGHPYYSVPLGTSLVAVPVAALALAADGDKVRADLASGQPSSIDPLAAALVTALTVTVVYLFAQAESGRTAVGLVAAGVFALGTAAWSTASRAMWMHGPSMLAVAVVVLLLSRLRRGPPSASTAVLLGVAVAAAASLRPTNLILAVGVLAWVSWVRRGALVPVLVGSACVTVAMLAANEVLLGEPLPRYVNGGRLAVTSVVPEALVGNLVSPSRGLLLYSPVLVLAVVGASLKRRSRSLTGLDLVLAVVVAGHLLAVSLFPHWWAGWAFGPRFMVDVLPIIVWFLVPVVEVCLDRSDEGRGAWALRTSFVLLLAVSIWINARGALRQETFAWNVDPVNVDAAPERLWDWSDPPFLR